MVKELETMLRALQLGNCGEDMLDEGLGLIDELDGQAITQNRVLVAQLFEEILRQSQAYYAPEDAAISRFPEELKKRLLTIFNNIRGIITEATAEEKEDGSVTLIIFLSFLEQHNLINGQREYGDISDIQPYVDGALTDLDDIRFVFDIKSEGLTVFPIEDMLTYVIRDTKFVSTTTTSLSPFHIRILKFAVRLFKDGEGQDELNELVKVCNLKFVEYLNPNDHIIDTDYLLNYRMNGSMTFIRTGSDRKILVRSNMEGYFSKSILSSMGLQVHKEFAKDGSTPIGWYVEFSYSGGGFTSAGEMMNRQETRREVLQLYFGEVRNVFLDMSLYHNEGDKIVAVNPFCRGDQYVIRDSKHYQKDSFKEVFEPYYNLPYAISRVHFFNRVFVGSFISLMEISEKRSKELLDITFTEDDIYQNQLIYAWIDAIGRKYEEYGELLRTWYAELEYFVRRDSSMNGEGVENLSTHPVVAQGFFPFSGDWHRLVGFISDEYMDKKVSLFEGLVSEEEGVLYVLIRDGKMATTVDMKDVSDRREVKDSLYPGQKCYVLYMEGHYYLENQPLLKKIYNLIRVFEKTMDYDTVCSVPEIPYEKVTEMMCLHKKGLSEEVGRIFDDKSFEDQVYYRLLHNMLYFGVNMDNMNDYFNVFLGHDVMDFSGIEDDPLFQMGDLNTLYVPKNAIKANSVLEDVYYNHIRRDAHRTKTGLYNEDIEIVDGKYARNGREIRRIVILCDNFERGTQTNHVIDAYFKINLKDENTKKELGRIHRYYCGGISISLKDIYTRNHSCDIEVHAYYGTAEGKEAIEKHMSAAGLNGYASFVHELRHKIGDIQTKAEQFFGTSGISGDAYAVIREFNMTKCNVFPDKMLGKPKRAITLFLKKKELKLPKSVVGESIDKDIVEQIKAITDREFWNEDDGASEVKKLERMIDEAGDGIVLDNDSRDKIEEFGILALKQYFQLHGVSDRDRESASVLTVVSVLPPRIRIAMWESILDENHSFIVLEKLSKAYAKDGKIDLLKERIAEWVAAGYVTDEMAEQLCLGAELLYTYRSRFPIANEITEARKNFEEVLTFTEAPEEFLDIMRLFLG